MCRATYGMRAYKPSIDLQSTSPQWPQSIPSISMSPQTKARGTEASVIGFGDRNSTSKPVFDFPTQFHFGSEERFNLYASVWGDHLLPAEGQPKEFQLSDQSDYRLVRALNWADGLSWMCACRSASMHFHSEPRVRATSVWLLLYRIPKSTLCIVHGSAKWFRFLS